MTLQFLARRPDLWNRARAGDSVFVLHVGRDGANTPFRLVLEDGMGTLTIIADAPHAAEPGIYVLEAGRPRKVAMVNGEPLVN